jgi:hypothetical protein
MDVCQCGLVEISGWLIAGTNHCQEVWEDKGGRLPRNDEFGWKNDSDGFGVVVLQTVHGNG